jgi:hypothetical protein
MKKKPIAHTISALGTRISEAEAMMAVLRMQALCYLLADLHTGDQDVVVSRWAREVKEMLKGDLKVVAKAGEISRTEGN